MSYKALRAVVALDNLEEGQIVNIDEYIEKLHFFKKYNRFGVGDRFKTEGTYITDHRYIEYSEIGLHYYKFDTLIKFFENFKHENGTKKALITFSKKPLFTMRAGKRLRRIKKWAGLHTMQHTIKRMELLTGKQNVTRISWRD